MPNELLAYGISCRPALFSRLFRRCFCGSFSGWFGCSLGNLDKLPDSVTNAMHKAAFDIWAAASSLAGETVERIQSEAGEAITKAKAELSAFTVKFLLSACSCSHAALTAACVTLLLRSIISPIM
jgi:hypothetical protein